MNEFLHPQAVVYTDGSCHTQLRLGAWVAIVFMAGKKVVLAGTQAGTTHNRMELTAVMKAVEYIKIHCGRITSIDIYTDSQYVAGLPARQEQLMVRKLADNSDGAMTNASLVKDFYSQLHGLPVNFIKVKAHQKSGGAPNYNIDADLLCRKMLREAVGKAIV